MKLVKRYKFEILLVFGISLVYFLIRLPNLTFMPIFADEAIYIRWAQVMRAEPTLRFLPLSDGKTPLYMWVLIPFFKISSDPLFAGRFLSVLSGYATLLGTLFLGWRFFNKKVGLWAAFLVAITPFTVFFDRTALVDSMLAAFSLWSLIAGLLLVKYPRIDLAMVLGYLLGGSMLVKPPGFFNLMSLPMTLVTFNWFSKERQKQFLRLFSLWIIAFAVTFGMYNILRLGPGFVNLSSRNQDYVFSPTKLLETPLDPLVPHIRDFFEWSYTLISFPTFLLMILGVIMAIVRRNKVAISIILWAMVPLTAEFLLLRTFTARYILFGIIPFLTISAFGLDQLFLFIKQRFYFKVLIMGILLVWPVYFNYLLLFDLDRAPLPANERRGYLETWTAGHGLRELAAYFTEISKKEVIVVGTEGSFGTLPDGLQIYLDKNRQVIIIGGKSTISAQLRGAATEHPTFFVANGQRGVDSYDGTELIKEFKKPSSGSFPEEAVILYRVLSDKEATISARIKR